MGGLLLERFILLFSVVGVTWAQKSVIAHMTNTKGSVKWGLDQGANGVELDLRFSREGYPTEFRHGGVCDCSCTCLEGCKDYGVCSALWAEGKSHCGARTGAEALTQYLGQEEIRSRLAIIYIDSKLDNSMKDYFGAGRRVVELLNTNVLAKGYKGQVIISGLEAKYIDYLKGALAAAKDSSYTDQYFYTLDGEMTSFNLVWDTLLSLGTKNIFYATGITICINKSFKDAIQGTRAKDGYAGIGIWTLDRRSSMEEYLGYGVTSIVTNIPANAVKVIGKENIAKPGEALRPVTRALPFTEIHKCDCGYRNDNVIKLWGGGCILTLTPPSGYACKCKVNAPYTCKGTVVTCSNSNSKECKDPTPNKATCQQGGGDCDGY